MFKLTGVGVVETELPTGRFVRVNRAFCEMLGYAEAELLELTFQDVTHPDDLARDTAYFEALVRGESRRGTSLTRVLRRDGEVMWLELHVTLLEGGGEAINIAVANDVTERERAGALLATSDADQRAILDSAEQSIMLIAPDYTLRVFNRYAAEAAARVFGLEMKAGGSFLQYVGPEDRESFTANFQKALSGREVSLEKRIAGLHGADWWEFFYYPLKSATGEVTGVTFTGRNVTERKRAEEALRESEEKYRTLFESMDEGFCIIEVLFEQDEPVDYRFLEVNPAFERQTGLTDATGKRMRELAPQHEARWFDLYGEVALTGEPRRFEQPAEQLDRWYDVYAFRVGEPEERKVAILFSDITGRKEAEERARRAAELDAFRVRLADALRPLADPVHIQAEACRLLGEHLGVDRAYYVEVNEAEDYARVEQDYLRGDSPSLAGTFRVADYGWIIPFLRRGETVIVADVGTSDRVPEADLTAMAAVKIAAHVSLPLVKEGMLVGALCVTEVAPRAWLETEVDLVREVAERIWAAVERARAEAALRESEEKFRAFVSATSDVVYRMSADWREMHSLVGKEFVATTDDPREDWTDEYIPETDKQTVWKAINQAIQTRRVFELEHRVVRLDGTIGWTFSRAIPVLNGAGEIVEWFGAASDITERKRAEGALHESEAKYRALFDSMDEGYAVVEVLADEQGAWRDFRFLEVNPAFEEHTGMVNAVGRKATEILGTPNPRWAQIYGRVAETGQPVRFEESEATLDRVFDLYAFRLAGEGSRRVAVLFTDVTERKRTEAALRASEERLRLTVESVSDYAIFTMDTQRRITSWNPGAEGIFGYSEEEAIGRSGDIISPPRTVRRTCPKRRRDKREKRGGLPMNAGTSAKTAAASM